MGYKKDVIKGISWTGSLSFLTKAVGFLETIILARILVPSQFGAYGIALIALGLLEVLTETGVNIVLVQEKEIDDLISSAWLVSIGRGLFITLFLFFTSPLISNFFNTPQALILLRLISLVPFLRGFINPSVVKFQKELRFARNFWYQAIILFVDTALSIIVTYITKQPIGIVIGLLTGVFVELSFSFIFVSPRPNFAFRKDYVSKIFHRGKWVTGSAIFDYLFYNTDNVVVGRFLGAGPLGIYQLAYSLAVIPLAEIGKVFFYVVVPILVKISSDVKRLRSMFIKTLLFTILFALPVVCIFLFLPQLFLFILGHKWVGILPILPILAVLGFVKALTGSGLSLFVSINKQEYTTIVTLVTILGLVITIVPFVLLWGIKGAAYSALLGSLLPLPVMYYYSQKLLKDKD